MATLPITNLTGAEIVYCVPTNSTRNPLGAFQQPTTTQAIANLAAGGIFSGTFVATGATAVSVANTTVLVTTPILISLNTVGGTPSAPVITTLTAGTGFTVTTGLGDTSTYNYTIFQ